MSITVVEETRLMSANAALADTPALAEYMNRTRKA
jgi:hypothetical protein